MRSARHITTKKNVYKRKINKRRYKSKSAWRWTQNLLNNDLENINEILRVHKTQRAEGKGAWKVVPKDSCEVYKSRRKRQTKSSHYEEENDERSIRTTDSKESQKGEKKIKGDGIRMKKEQLKKSRRRRRQSYKHRHSQQPPDSTSNSTSSTYSSCFSSSEMDYE